MAHGIADDFLSTAMLAATAKVLVCPAMNDRMFANPAVQDNLSILRNRGIYVMAPESGELACGSDGPGRLPDPTEILEQAEILLSIKTLKEPKSCNRRSHSRTAGSGPVHQQPVIRKNGLCRGPGGRAAGGGCCPGERPDVYCTAHGRFVLPGSNGP